MKILTFDKSNGFSRLIEESLGARINLRKYASYRRLIIIGVFVLLSQLFYGAPFGGIFALLIINLFSIVFLSIYDFIAKIV